MSDLQQGINIADLLAVHTTVFPSKGEARKMIQAGGAAINKTKIATADDIYNIDNLINSKFLVAQKGKKNYFLIIAE
jgi:tyrosyl-tRNA synthetase